MSKRSQRTGRKDSTERIRELMALVGSLAHTGDTITVEGIAARLGVTRDETQALVDIVCQASGEESSGLLISCNDDETEFTLQYPGIHGRPVRLTQAETIAVVHALDVAGVPADHPLRARLQAMFSSAAIAEQRVRQALGAPAGDETLMRCARAQAESRALVFWYQGVRDHEPRERRALVRALRPVDGTWQVAAYDLVAGGERIFRTDRMSDVELGEYHDTTPQYQPQETQRVRVTIRDKTYYELFDWPGLRVLDEVDGVLYGDITYFGPEGGWLARRVAACDGTVVVESAEVMAAAREYARAVLGR